MINALYWMVVFLRVSISGFHPSAIDAPILFSKIIIQPVILSWLKKPGKYTGVPNFIMLYAQKL